MLIWPEERIKRKRDLIKRKDKMAVASISTLGYFLPIFSFLLVFIVIYALLKKTEVLGGSEPIMLFVALILASFFVVEVSLVEFVQFSSAYFATIVIGVFFLLILLAFMPWENNLKFLQKKDWFSWALLTIIVIMFLFSAYYTFNWAINWDAVTSNSGSDWFGFILLIVIAGVVAATIKGKKG